MELHVNNDVKFCINNLGTQFFGKKKLSRASSANEMNEKKYKTKWNAKRVERAYNKIQCFFLCINKKYFPFSSDPLCVICELRNLRNVEKFHREGTLFMINAHDVFALILQLLCLFLFCVITNIIFLNLTLHQKFLGRKVGMEKIDESAA